jgi:hypothetical protein
MTGFGRPEWDQRAWMEQQQAFMEQQQAFQQEMLGYERQRAAARQAVGSVLLGGLVGYLFVLGVFCLGIPLMSVLVILCANLWGPYAAVVPVLAVVGGVLYLVRRTKRRASQR